MPPIRSASSPRDPWIAPFGWPVSSLAINTRQKTRQDALLRAWRSAASLRDPAGFQASFDRILVNVCRDRLRRRGKVRLVAIDEMGIAPTARDPLR